MSDVTQRIELSKDGYAKIETRIKEIEDLAMGGYFSYNNPTSRFQQIVSETKLLRQTLREELLIAPIQA